MSYILDALKKAEAERNNGATAEPRFAPRGRMPAPAVPVHPSTRRKSLSWLALTVLAGMAGIAAWLRFASVAAPAPSPAVENRPAAAVQPGAIVSMQNDETVHKADADREENLPAKPAKTGNARKAAVKMQPAEAETIVTLRELPDSIQQRIPALQVGGYIYSANRADRSILINNRLLREGEEIAPGLRLEKMMPNGMVLHFQGYRFRVGY